jgi:hypothetical protein
MLASTSIDHVRTGTRRSQGQPSHNSTKRKLREDKIRKDFLISQYEYASFHASKELEKDSFT